METQKGDIKLIITRGENNLVVRNCTKTDDNNESATICKLNDFFSNNIELSNISILQLENCGLNEIPSNIQKLNLTQLILTHNKLREVPSCLYSGLNALVLLDLSHNFIKSFDIEPACSYTIVTLRLNDNKIRNLPHWILNLRCPKLEELIYSNNYLTDLRVSRQLNLKKLEMCNCQLMDVDFQFIKSLRSLEYLNISNTLDNRCENSFKNIDDLFVNAKWTNLKALNLSNHVVSILPKGIFWLVSLTELYLDHCDLSWIPSDIQYLTNLTVLDVSNNTICSLPSELTTLTKLVVIKAACNSISSVADFGNLEILDLYNNCLDACPACATNVKFIDLEQNYFETEDDEEYERKRDLLRQIFSYSRTNGCKNLPEPPYFEENSMSHSDSEGSVCYEDGCDLDNWVEEKPVIVKQRNPEVTPSDDEWDGKLHLEESKKRDKIEFDIYEDWIFCDAEE